MMQHETLQNADQQGDPNTGGILAGKRATILFVAAVIAAECLIVYFFFPRSDRIASPLPFNASQTAQFALDGDAFKLPTSKDKPVAEVELGTFSITAHQPITNTTMRIDFHLVGTVLEREKAEFLTIFSRTEHRFRDQTIVEIRNSEISDLTDPGLGLIKRRILEKSNRLFGKPILQSVVFSDFSFVEQ